MDVLREIVLPRLEGVTKRGGYWMARCPAKGHEDREASLSITYGKKHPVVFDCKATCAPEDVLAGLGLTWDDLSAPREEQREQGEWTPRGEAVAVYDYTDEDGNLLFQVLRTADKHFSQRIPDATSKSGWRWRLGDTRRVLYRLPKVIAAADAGEIIYICEGEKDVHALEGAGAVATCNPGGAGKWRDEYAAVFTDAVVRIVADVDKPGQAHARQVAASLEGVARATEIVEAAEGKDAADHLAAGLGLDEFAVTWDGGVLPQPDLAPDLATFLGVEDPPEDWIIPDLLERGDRLIWTGLEGLGKSMVTRQLAISAAAGLHPFTDHLITPQSVLFIDCENPVRYSRRHFRSLAFTAQHKTRPVPEGGFRIIHRTEGVDLSREDELAWLLERVTAHKPDLLVIGPLYKLHGLDINDETAARVVTSALDQARLKVDCALIIEAHAPHGEAGKRSLRVSGSSLFRRWPEFGIGICPHPDAGDAEPCKHVSVRHWRGSRAIRDWPRELVYGRQGLDWPWVVPAGSPAPQTGLRSVG